MEIRVPYGDAVDPGSVEQALRVHPESTAVFATLCETSTGVVHDIEALGAVVGRTDAVLVVDAISGLLADPCPTNAWGIDVLVGGSQKALMVPPGLSFLSIGPKAWRLVERASSPRFYFDLHRYRKAAAEGDAPFTSSVPLVAALDEALRLIFTDGIEATLDRCRMLAEAARAGVEAMGLTLFAKRPSNGLTAVAMPPGVDSTGLIRHIRRVHHVRFANGQGDMAGTMIRMGSCHRVDRVGTGSGGAGRPERSGRWAPRRPGAPRSAPNAHSEVRGWLLSICSLRISSRKTGSNC
jgi:aspartate aminotransferase-like enzyme